MQSDWSKDMCQNHREKAYYSIPMNALSSSQISISYFAFFHIDSITKTVELMGEKVIFVTNVEKQHKYLTSFLLVIYQ